MTVITTVSSFSSLFKLLANVTQFYFPIPSLEFDTMVQRYLLVENYNFIKNSTLSAGMWLASPFRYPTKTCCIANLIFLSSVLCLKHTSHKTDFQKIDSICPTDNPESGKNLRKPWKRCNEIRQCQFSWKINQKNLWQVSHKIRPSKTFDR